ncbi:DUF3906 family protein [Paenibacillus arenilitoris]|uniref:DUF3906 family protein n=1 Tax=Paenibacillus arenilitoris TaxID=2772299 RepID=A0A927H9Q1_9BACL|nr:DUF3906 family protein [Paenibacillus arenilitoris]MBD2872973.1 DUF3906 family protein [Paenibacillus arenilitoris]
MFLYKIEIELADRLAYLVILADSDEKALNLVESHVERHFIKKPDIRSIALVEKKRVENGSGYIVEGPRH